MAPRFRLDSESRKLAYLAGPIEQKHRNSSTISSISESHRLAYLRLRRSQRWPEDGMRKCEVIFARALKENPVKRPHHIGVIGAGTCPVNTYGIAKSLGFEIGKKGWTLVCGGLQGVMEGAARGCSEAGGMSLGILPGLDKRSANPYITVPIPTGLGDGRNLLVVRSSDILVAVAGGYGTLSEIALALKAGKPVIGLKTWKEIPGVQYAEDYLEAIQLITTLLPLKG